MAYTPTDYDTYDFANRRHIGPSPSEMDEMLKVVGVPSLDALIDETVPKSIQQKTPLSWAPLAEHELLEKMRGVAAKNKVMTSLIGQGYYGTRDAARDPAQHPGKPGLVYRLHPLSARDRARAAGGVAELPDHGLRPDRPAGGERVPAGRGDGGGRGHGDGRAGVEIEIPRVLR